MGRKGASVRKDKVPVQKDKVPYEIEREEKVKENYLFLQKLGGVIPIPREIRAIVEGDSSQNESSAKKVAHTYAVSFCS
jgi:hypothetical protein